MIHDIRLTYGALSVIFRNWRSADLPRSDVPFPSGDPYSKFGTKLTTGISFTRPEFWNISAHLIQADYDALTAIWAKSDAARRSGGDPYVILDDESQEVFEDGATLATLTRSVVTGTIPRQLNGGVYSYGRFQAEFKDPPKFGRWGRLQKAGALNCQGGVRVCPVDLILEDTRILI